MKNISILFLFFVCEIVFAQENGESSQLYFIGEKIKEEPRPYIITHYAPVEKIDCKGDEEDERCYPMKLKRKCLYGKQYYSKYRIIKILKGKYTKETIEFYSMYCSEFGYRIPLQNKYTIIGVMKQNDLWGQNYIEKVYNKNSEWILPYKISYPFIDYTLMQPEKLKNSQRVKLNISKEYYETLRIGEYNLPYYQKKRKYATALYGFVL